MKRLFIVRHAKSSWNYPHLTDFQRPLNNRGERDLPDMANRFASSGFEKPDLLISSPAVRALTTAHGHADVLTISQDQIKLEEHFYHASTSTIKTILSKVSDNIQTLMIFGHNPGLTYLINELSDFYLYNLPTCAICGIEFSFENWSDILSVKGRKFYYDFPKSRLTDQN